MMKKKLLISIQILFAVAVCVAQEPHFSQFYMNPLFVNPAFAGNSNCLLRVGSNYADQWRSLGNPYQTYSFFGDVKMNINRMPHENLGVGLAFYGDKAGAGNLRTNDLRAYLAYHKGLLKDSALTVSLGLSFAYISHTFDPDKLFFESQWTGTSFNTDIPNQEIFNSIRKKYFDMGAGIQVTYQMKAHKIGLGALAGHLTNPRYSYYKSTNRFPVKMTLNGYYEGSMSKSLSLYAGVLYTAQDKTNECIFGANLCYKPQAGNYFIGLWYRYGRDLIPNIGIEIKKYRFMLSYDVNVSEFKVATKYSGGFQISLIKQFFSFEESKGDASKNTPKI